MVLPVQVQPAFTSRSYPTFRPEICVQYKDEYSLMLRATSKKDPIVPMILKQFHDDVKALKLEPPIEPDEVELISKSSQVKATYSVRHRSSCDILKSLVMRMFSSGGFKEVCAERFIARVLYIEGGSTVSSDTISTIPTVQRRLEESNWSSSSSQTPAAHRLLPVVHRSTNDMLCDKASTFRSVSLKLPSRHIQNDAKRNPVPDEPQLQTPRPATMVINSLRVRSAVRQQPAHPPICAMVSLTPNTCLRLRDARDSVILVSEPTVRVLMLRDAEPGVDAPPDVRRMAFVTDGETYTFVALAQTSGHQDGWLYAGAAIKIKSMHRLPAGLACPVVITSFCINFADQVVSDTVEMRDSPSLMVQTISASTASTMDTDGHGPNQELSLRERIEELVGELDRERGRRRQLERALADVCKDLIEPPLVPAAIDMFMGLSDIANGIGEQ
ncbi:hypothetical protein C8Q73DRAFT_686986 [Cubamyces lactineus]|nr:hypothetical protein C8Q73DRAFT_686986 [Cubamyces lactineus]